MSIIDNLASENVVRFDLTPSKKRIAIYEKGAYLFDTLLDKTEM